MSLSACDPHLGEQKQKASNRDLGLEFSLAYPPWHTSAASRPAQLTTRDLLTQRNPTLLFLFLGLFLLRLVQRAFL
jgi:hypothetical protein